MLPKNEKREYVKGRILGVDLGIKYPAYMSLNNREHVRSSYGSFEDFFKVRTQINSRRQRLQKALETTKGGRSRKSKLKALDTFYKKERNWSFYELIELITYKAELEGIKVEAINPVYTSQRCSDCGIYLEKIEKPKKNFYVLNVVLKRMQIIMQVKI